MRNGISHVRVEESKNKRPHLGPFVLPCVLFPNSTRHLWRNCPYPQISLNEPLLRTRDFSVGVLVALLRHRAAAAPVIITPCS